MKHQLYTRTYEGDNGEEVVVIGNRKDISDPVENVMEAEFVFRNGELTAVNPIQFKTRETTRSRMHAFDDHLDDLAFETIEVLEDTDRSGNSSRLWRGGTQ